MTIPMAIAPDLFFIKPKSYVGSNEAKVIRASVRCFVVLRVMLARCGSYWKWKFGGDLFCSGLLFSVTYVCIVGRWSIQRGKARYVQ